MKIAVVIALSFGAGWFTNKFLQFAIEGKEDWRNPAIWAGAAAVEVMAILIIFR